MNIEQVLSAMQQVRFNFIDFNNNDDVLEDLNAAQNPVIPTPRLNPVPPPIVAPRRPPTEDEQAARNCMNNVMIWENSLSTEQRHRRAIHSAAYFLDGSNPEEMSRITQYHSSVGDFPRHHPLDIDTARPAMSVHSRYHYSSNQVLNPTQYRNLSRAEIARRAQGRQLPARGIQYQHHH